MKQKFNLDKHLKFYRLDKKEYKVICDHLGRAPKGLEWALYSALWSEHCSYKSSKYHLKKFYSKSERVLKSFGENAGVIDLGEGERVAFKMESHNHPSFIEPFQGAATGVGGILRDIFTMGARPIALANFLCFGEIENKTSETRNRVKKKSSQMQNLVDGVVRGISFYGNCVGVPTITGQTEFDKSYNENILVNALAVGLFKKGQKIFTSEVCGPKNFVVYVGAKTGKDGIHGASMASESFDKDNKGKKPNVQIGDPFLEKLLIEACLEVMEENLVEAIQDMGAAGLTSSSFEMSAKGGLGLTLHLDKVPCRDNSINPEEILLSESQERMLIICKPENFSSLKEIFKKWDLDAVCIGEVREEKNIQIFWKGEKLCDIDPADIINKAPEYERPYAQWQPKYIEAKKNEETKQILLEKRSQEENKKLLFKILSEVRGCSRDWIFNQYDQRVGGSTVRDAANSFGVLRLPESRRALALVLGMRPYMMRLDAREGGKDAVAYPALELCAKGFEPLALTDCLNFGNPEKPELMSEFVASLEAMSDQCESLDIPVISGNVSFYNETLNKNITSSPTTGLVGIKSNMILADDNFTTEKDVVLLVQSPQLFSKGQIAEVLGEDLKAFGSIDTKIVAHFARNLRTAVNECEIHSSRLVGKFGRAYALAKMTLGGLGFISSHSASSNSKNLISCENSSQLLCTTQDLFSETNYEVLFAMKETEVEKFKNYISNYKVFELGRVGGKELILDDLKVDINEIYKTYYQYWEKHFESLA